MLTFAHPLTFLLLPLPWVVSRIRPPRDVRPVAVRVPFGKRIRASLDHQPTIRKATRNWRELTLQALVWFMVVAAMARPQWLQPPVTRDVATRDLLLLVDLSGSMQAEDFTNAAGDTVNRLSAVKEVLGDFLLRREGDRVGLVVFGDAPFLQAPFSTDLNLARQLLNETEIGMAGPRTAFGDAIGLGVNLFESSEAPAKTIIALTDGNDTKSQVPPVEAARIAHQRNIRIHAVAIGDPTTLGEEKLDEEALRGVAESSGGSYFFAGDRNELAGIYDQLDRIETRKVNVISYRPRNDLYYWPLVAGLLISLGSKAWVVGRATHRDRTIPAPKSVRVDAVTGMLSMDE